jgi:hypothetical protein
VVAQPGRVLDAVEEGHQQAVAEHVGRHPLKGGIQLRGLDGDQAGVDRLGQSPAARTGTAKFPNSPLLTDTPLLSSAATVWARARQTTSVPLRARSPASRPPTPPGPRTATRTALMAGT